MVIARGNKPAVRIVPVIAEPERPKRQFGRLKGLVSLDESFFEPMSEEDLRRWEGERARLLRLLLDTHALVWWTAGDEKLPLAIRQIIADEANQVFASPVSAFEIAQKHRLGKLPSAAKLTREFEASMESEGFTGLPISLGDARLAGAMQHSHCDPFDRMLIAQALNDLILISNERLFDDFGVKRLW